jgi:hypothetical protein
VYLEDKRDPRDIPRTPHAFVEAEMADGTIRRHVNLNDVVRRIVLELQSRYGWSQNEVAKFTGIPQQTLNTFMTKGNMTVTTFSKLLDSSIALGLADWLREHMEESATQESERLAALPEGTKKKRGRPRKK